MSECLTGTGLNSSWMIYHHGVLAKQTYFKCLGGEPQYLAIIE